MHIPDNYLSPATCAVISAAMMPIWTVSIKKVKLELPKEKIPMLGIGAASSFLMMMFNLPLPGGTTGHAVGGALIAMLLGPYAACISVTVALFLQAIMFGDGGILAFAANCFNMAFILPFTSYYIYSKVKAFSKGKIGEYIGIASGAYIGLNLAALFTAIEFGIQPFIAKDSFGQALYCPYPLSVSIPAMMIPHLLVAGFVEAIITVLVVGYIKKVSPNFLYEEKKEKGRGLYGIILGLICLTPLGLLASGTAWGEWGADEISEVLHSGSKLGYVPAGMKNGFQWNVIMPDYAVHGLTDVAGYLISAVAGVAILIILFKVIGEMGKTKRRA